MNLSDLVVSQPLAERMRELGWPQDNSFAYWCGQLRIPLFEETFIEWSVFDFKAHNFTCEPQPVAAPTFAEVWEKLKVADGALLLVKDKYDRTSMRIALHETEYYSNPAEAAGMLWCFIQEKKKSET